MGPVLITGATGFIGSHLSRRLVSSGHEVHVFARAASDFARLEELRPQLRVWQADLRDGEAVERACAEIKPRLVFHLAGSTEVRLLDPKLEHVRESVAVNVMGSVNLVLALHRVGGVEKLVRVGGLEEYGRGPAPYREEQREQPVSPYSASQVAVTHYYQMLRPSLSFELLTLRPALTYGPAQSERFLIPALIRACLEGRDFRMTSGEQRRDFIFIDDIIDALCSAATTKGLSGEVFNIGSGVATRISDVAQRIVALTGASIELQLGASQARGSEIHELVCDPSKARERLGFVASTSLDAGLLHTIAWARNTLACTSR